jgi:hypothetical protein
MSNVPNTFVLKLTILVAKFVPFFWFQLAECKCGFYLVINNWSSLANFGSIATFKWWHTIVSIDFCFC